MSRDRVLIVGGGVAGLSLAIALRQRGIMAAVVERGDSETTAGAGLYLVGAATRGLAALGVLDATTRAGAVSRSQAFYTHRGRRLAEIDTEAFWSPCGPCLGIARAVLHRLLTERAAAGLAIRYGTSIVALTQDAEAVSVECTDGSRAMAVEDALILAEFLGDAARGPEVLARFQQRRAPRVRWLRAQTDRRDRLRRLPVAIRNVVLRLRAERTYEANYRPLLAPP